MTWQTVTGCLCHKWPQICSTCRNHIPVFSSFRTSHRVCKWSNKTGVTCGEGYIRIRKSMKDRQYTDQMKKDKRTKSDLQNTTQKTKHRDTRTSLKPGLVLHLQQWCLQKCKPRVSKGYFPFFCRFFPIRITNSWFEYVFFTHQTRFSVYNTIIMARNIKSKTKTYHALGTVWKYDRKIVETVATLIT
jgi:hypothetical protein